MSFYRALICIRRAASDTHRHYKPSSFIKTLIPKTPNPNTLIPYPGLSSNTCRACSTTTQEERQRNLSDIMKPKTVEEPKEEPEPESENQGRTPVEDEQMIFERMKESGLIPNAVAMLDGLCKGGLVGEAMKLFGEMKDRGTLPDVIIYTAAVEGFCRAGQMDKAKRVFQKMKDKGVKPNAFTYWILVQGLSKAAMLSDASAYSLEMFDRGWSPDPPTIVGLVDSFCHAERRDDAKKLLFEFKEKGYDPRAKFIVEFLEKHGPFHPHVRDVILGKGVLHHV